MRLHFFFFLRQIRPRRSFLPGVCPGVMVVPVTPVLTAGAVVPDGQIPSPNLSPFPWRDGLPPT
jgi:hypothetical protein